MPSTSRPAPSFEFARFGLIFVGVSFLLATICVIVIGITEAEFHVRPNSLGRVSSHFATWPASWPDPDTHITVVIGPERSRSTAAEQELMFGLCLVCLAIAGVLERGLSKHLP